MIPFVNLRMGIYFENDHQSEPVSKMFQSSFELSPLQDNQKDNPKLATNM